jgi:STE24 endopeptidase
MMNAIAIVVLSALLLDWILGLVADRLNLRQVDPELPAAFQGWYDPAQYEQAQRYLIVTTRFGWVVGTFGLVAVLTFWWSGGFGWLDTEVRRMHDSVVVRGLIYIGLLMAAKTLLDLPFGVYATFAIEQRFGFNQTTWRTFALDRLKALSLALLLGGPLLALILSFLQYSGALAFFYCWLAVVAVTLLMHYVAPVWIMPIFNRFEPLPQGELRDAILDYARRIDFALDNIFVMDGSRRSTKSNAFFTGFGKHRRIVLFDTLIERHSVDELVAVLAHEMGHYRQKHIPKMMVIGIVQIGVMFYIMSFLLSRPELFAAFKVREASVYTGLVFFGLLYAPFSGIFSLVVQAISRRHEYAADRFALQTAPNGMAMVTALKKLSVHNLSNLRPHPLYVFLHYSHPPVLQRIAAIEKAAAASAAASGAAGMKNHMRD